jgi:hypothetical protein
MLTIAAVKAGNFVWHLLALVLLHGISAQQTCLEKMLQQGLPEGWLKTLTPRSRQLPDASRIDLSATDWEGPVSWNSKASTLGQVQDFTSMNASSSEGPPEDLCRKDRGVLRYKVGVSPTLVS